MQAARLVAVCALSLASIAGAGAGAGPATAASTSSAPAAVLRIDPPVVAVLDGQRFGVQVVTDATVAASGAQVSVDFDPAILQVEAVARGGAYAASPIFLPKNLGATLAAANASGHLAQIAAAFTPPGSVAAGPASFLVVTFRAVGCGRTDLVLPTGTAFDAQMISGRSADYGEVVPVVTAGASVTTCVADEQVTADAVDLAADTTSDFAPVALLVGIGGLAAAVLGGFLWRARRRPPARATSRGGSMRRR